VTAWNYIAQSVPWMLAGLLVGWLMGRSTVAVETIAEAVQEGDDVPETTTPATNLRRRRRFNATHFIGVLLVLLGAFTIVQAYLQDVATERQSRATERLAQCTNAYASGFADAIEQRSKSTAEAQDALDTLLSEFAKITPTPDGRDAARRALSDYLTKRAEAKRTQAENPYPAPPRDVCR